MFAYVEGNKSSSTSVSNLIIGGGSLLYFNDYGVPVILKTRVLKIKKGN